MVKYIFFILILISILGGMTFLSYSELKKPQTDPAQMLLDQQSGMGKGFPGAGLRLGAQDANMSSYDDSTRQTHVNTIANAITQLMVDQSGKFPTGTQPPETYVAFSTDTKWPNGGSPQKLCEYLMGTNKDEPVSYLASLPIDPALLVDGPFKSCVSFDTGYQIKYDPKASSFGQVFIKAPRASVSVETVR